MGCCIIDLRVVKHLERPLFKTTEFTRNGVAEQVSQDAWFSHNLRQAGYIPMLDTNVQCIHVCRATGKYFGSPDIIGDKNVLAAEYAVKGCGEKDGREAV